MEYKPVSEPWHVDQIYRCPCCSYRTLHSRGGFEVCPVCFWEDDGQDDPFADKVNGGPNGLLTLTEARRNFRDYGLCEPSVNRDFVRRPTDSEL